MSFRGDRRAVTVQVGAVLLLGFLVIALSLYQAQVVPQENEQVEFRHSQEVQQDMVDLRNAVVRSAAGGPGQPTTVQLGTRYPARALFVNPPPPVGRLASGDALPRSRSTGNLTVSNVSVVNSVGADETGDFWSGERNVSTTAIVYDPSYSVYRNAPETVYENTVLYNRFDGGNITLANQTLVDGRTITVVTLVGNLSLSRTRATAVDPRAVSASTRTVTVQNDSTGNVTLTVPTSLPPGAWQELTSRERYVEEVVDAGKGRVKLVLSNETTYNLRMAKVGIGTGVRSSGTAYLTTVEKPSSVPSGESRRIVVEARDRFNNPVSGRAVAGPTVSRSDLSLVDANVSDEEGRVGYEFQPATAGDYTLNFSVGPQGEAAYNVTSATFDPSLPENVQVNVSATAGGGGGDGASRATTLLDTSFENGLDGWTTNESTQVTRTPTPNGSGYQSVQLEGSAPLYFQSPELAGAGYGYFDVEYWVQEGDGNSGPEPGEPLNVEYLNDEGSWKQIDRLDAADPADGATYRRRVVVSDADAAHAGLRLRFRRPSTSGSDEWFVDEVRVIGVGSASGSGGGAVADRSGVVYVNPNANKKSAIEYVTGDDGTVTTITRANSGSSVEGLGPYTANLDGDGRTEVAYVNSKDELHILDANGGATELDTNVDQRRLTVGDYDDDGNDEAYYVRGSGSAIYKASGSEGPTLVFDATSRGFTLGAVAGVADVDGDDKPELVFTTRGPAAKYLDDDGSVEDTGYGQNLQNPDAIGNPADYDGDGYARVPVVDGSGNVDLIDATNGNVESLGVSGVVSTSPLASSDVDGDGEFEIVFATSSSASTQNELRYIEVSTATVEVLKDGTGSTVAADNVIGAA